MKLIITLCVTLVASISLSAQKESELTPDLLIFSDLADPFSGSTYGFDGFNLQSGFNFVSGNAAGQLRAGDDLQFSMLDRNGILVNETAVISPTKSSVYGLNNVIFTVDDGTDVFNWVVEAAPTGTARTGFRITEDYFDAGIGMTFLSEAFYIAPSDGTGNNIGIGTTSPLGKVQIEQLNHTAPGLIVINENEFAPGEGIGVAAEAGFIGVQGYALDTMTMGDIYGIFGIAEGRNGEAYSVFGLQSDPGNGVSYAGYFDGDVTVTGTFSNPSDEKLKTDIQPLRSVHKKSGTTSLDKINQLQPKRYQYKKELSDRMQLPQGQQIGFIAQEVQSVFPELVKQNSNPGREKGDQTIDFLGINYLGLVPVNTAGIQELSQENDELKQRIASLENQLAQILSQTKVR